ncbi:MAG: tetratricopeptide repeat protein, partial [Spirochaetales bacterium]|nr:tetratricopeptide repeat protein [Spirochaetales bacterium]
MPRLRFFATLLTFFLLTGALMGQTAVQDYRAGQAAFARDDTWGAIDAYRRALAINPHYQDALQGIAEAFFSLGNYDEAYRQVERALRLGRLSIPVNLLYGRILLGQGKLEQALAVFRDILDREPKNRGARFGIAEYQVMKGRLGLATELFEALLRENPADLRAELSLMYIAEDRDDRVTFERTFQDALQYHSSDFRVHYAAARFAYQEGDLALARREIDAALKLSQFSVQAWIFQSQLLLDEGKAAQAVQTIDDKIINSGRSGAKNSQAWYLRGLAEEALGQIPEAVKAFRMALTFAPENETYRWALEDLLKRKTPEDDPLRAEVAQDHFRRAAELAANNYDQEALVEYRRGLLVDPFSVKARLARAKLLNQEGLRTSSLQELETIAKLRPDYKAVSFQDELEIQKSLYDDSLPAQWNLKLSDLDSLDSVGTSSFFRPFRVGLYYVKGSSHTASYKGDTFFAEDFADDVSASRSWEVDILNDGRRTQRVSGFNDAFSLARAADQEFFILLTFQEGQRDFSATARLCLTRTGRTIQTFSVYHKGLRPDAAGILDLSRAVRDVFPLRGSLIQRDGTKALVNLGSRDGVKVGQTFQVIRDQAGDWTGDASWFAVNDADVLGSWTVTKVSDWVSQGDLTQAGFFDTMAPGELVLFVHKSTLKPLPPPLP